MADELRRKFKIVECGELCGGRSAGVILIVCGPALKHVRQPPKPTKNDMFGG